jgi:peptidoglycan/LPS O-acetylase OafA/YrhL
LSLTVCDLMLHKAATVFFLTPYRVYEFGIGAILVWIISYQPKNKLWLELLLLLLLLLGLMLIVYPVLTFTAQTPFPSFNALIPCLGAALAIYAGTAKYTGMILRNKFSVKIGLISYLLYLIHWPVYVYYKYFKLDELNLTEKVLICIASVLCALVMHELIEKPFRKDKGEGKFSPAGYGFACAMLALLLSLPAASMWANSGWPWRFKNIKNLERLFMTSEFDNYVWLNHDQLRGDFSHSGSKKIF